MVIRADFWKTSYGKADFYVSYTTIYRSVYVSMFNTKEQRDSCGNRGAIKKLRRKTWKITKLVI